MERGGRRRRAASLNRLAVAAIVTIVSCQPGGSASTALPSPSIGESSSASQPASAAPLPVEFVVALEEALGTDYNGRGAIDRFWTELLVGEEYATPSRLVPFEPGEVPAIECAAGSSADRWRDNATYCPDDAAIAFDVRFLLALWEDIGEIAPVAVLAHEWGHHVQALGSVPEFSLQRELQADCYAGMYLMDILRRREEFDTRTAAAAVQTLIELGNDTYRSSEWFAEDEHGSGRVRVAAYGTGLGTFDGRPLCEGYAEYEPEAYVDIGPHYRLVEVPGMAGELSETGSSFTIDTPYGTARLIWIELPPEGRSAERLLIALRDEIFGDAITTLDGPRDIDPVYLRGEASSIEYDLRVGETDEYDHGMFTVFLPPIDAGGVLVIDVYRDGRTPDDSDAEHLEFTQDASMLYQLITRLCGPGNTAKEGDPLHNVACLDGL